MAIIITEEMLTKANDYLTLNQKEAMAAHFAIACVDENGKRSESGKLPPLLTERFGIKQQYMMGVLAQLYLGVSFKKQSFEMRENGKDIRGVLDCCMSVDAYDEWASSHVYSQMNRFVRDRKSPVADKAYEILNDLKTFGMMLDKSIKDLIERRNDPVDRIAQALMQSITPETMAQTMQSIGEIEALAEKIKGEGKE